MPDLTVKDIRYHAHKAGFTGQAQTVATAIALAESGGNPVARFTNTDGSVDRGLWQINSTWHAEVSDAQADDPAQAAVAAYRISHQGTDFTPWSTYTNGAYKAHLTHAAGQTMPQPTSTPGPMRTVLARPFSGPVVITQPFGPTDVTAEPMGYYLPDGAVMYSAGNGIAAQHCHAGVDYSLAEGTPLHAPAAGTVIMAGWSPTGFGNRTIIDHGDVLTLYGHQQSIAVQVGQTVAKGDLIGHVGHTGNVIPQGPGGAHLHLSCLDGPNWRHNNLAVYLDPSRYILAW